MKAPTEREIEVLVALVENASEKDAARDLGISRSAVKARMENLYERIGARSRAHAAWLLYRTLHDRYRLPGDKRVERRRAA